MTYQSSRPSPIQPCHDYAQHRGGRCHWPSVRCRRGSAVACALLLPALWPGRSGAGSWQYFAEWGSLGWTVEQCRPALAWTAEGLPAAAWSEGGMGWNPPSPAHAVSFGWFDSTGALQTREITAIRDTSEAPVELIMRPGDRPLVLFAHETGVKGRRRLSAARADRLAGPWKIDAITEGAITGLTAAGTWREGLVRAAWFDEERLSLWFAEEGPEGTWRVEEITALGGRGPSLILLPDDRPWIAFQGGDAATLWFAEQESGGWRIEQVGAGGTYTSAALDAAGQPAVAHIDPLGALVLFQPFTGGLPGAPVPVYSGVVSQLALAFDPVGRPHVAMSRSELVPDPWCTTATLYTLETASPDPESGEGWTASGVDSNVVGCMRAGCAEADFSRSDLSWSPQGLPALLYQENCIAHPMAHRTVRLAFLSRPWDTDAQPVITDLEPAPDGGIAVTWSAAPGACYSLWAQSLSDRVWAALASDLCPPSGQTSHTHRIPAAAIAAGAWIRVDRDYP